MVPAAQTLHWTEQETVSKAIKRICGERMLALEMNSQEHSWEMSSSLGIKEDAPPGDTIPEPFHQSGKPSFLMVVPSSLSTLQL